MSSYPYIVFSDRYIKINQQLPSLPEEPTKPELKLVKKKWFEKLILWCDDYDDECIKWFSKIIKENNLKNIDCFKSDYFKNIQKKYDLILSNPPQLPMISGGLHDSGGYDGRQYILEIMKESINHLNDEGVLYMLMFDFIGTFIKTNNSKSILEIARDIGYNSIDLVFEITKKIKKDSVTYNNIIHK